MSYVPDDSQQVTIALSPPIGVLTNPLFPSVVKWGQSWGGTIGVANVGGSTAFFSLRFTGDITGTSDIIVLLEPGWEFRFVIEGVGPREFQVHAELADWEECVTVGLTKGVGLKTTRTVLGSEVVVEVGETVEGDTAEGELSGNILCNTGGRSGWFKVVDEEFTYLIWLRAGRCIAHHVTPLSAHVARFSTTDSATIYIGHAGFYGCELRDWTIPRFGVDEGEQWEGSIEAWNIGGSTGTFRLVMTGDIVGTSNSFELGPGEHTTVMFAGTGITPYGFAATLQRMVDSGWIGGYSVDEKVGERIMGWIQVIGRINMPPAYYENVPKGKVTLDGEQVLETSSLGWEPIQVASGRTYRVGIWWLGYTHFDPANTVSWNEERWHGYHGRFY